jgi:chromosome segregation ATPase
MSNDLFDKDGNLVEGAMTPQEIETKLDEERERIIEETNQNRQGEIDDLSNQLNEKETTLSTLQEELTKEKSKDKNLSGQRGVIEAKEKEIAEMKTGLDTIKKEMEGMKNDFTNKDKQMMIEGMIDKLAEGDIAMKDKMKFHYGGFKTIDPTNKKPEDVQKEIEQRVKSAYILATGGQRTVPLSGPIISGAGGVPMVDMNPNGEKISDGGKDVASKFGITDQELKKNKLL